VQVACLASCVCPPRITQAAHPNFSEQGHHGMSALLKSMNSCAVASHVAARPVLQFSCHVFRPQVWQLLSPKCAQHF
jgi:hypothetical protein